VACWGRIRGTDEPHVAGPVLQWNPRDLWAGHAEAPERGVPGQQQGVRDPRRRGAHGAHLPRTRVALRPSPLLRCVAVATAHGHAASTRKSVIGTGSAQVESDSGDRRAVVADKPPQPLARPQQDHAAQGARPPASPPRHCVCCREDRRGELRSRVQGLDGLSALTLLAMPSNRLTKIEGLEHVPDLQELSVPAPGRGSGVQSGGCGGCG
jgi:hypothetical protein